jgi:hypothetical protein
MSYVPFLWQLLFQEASSLLFTNHLQNVVNSGSQTCHLWWQLDMISCGLLLDQNTIHFHGTCLTVHLYHKEYILVTALVHIFLGIGNIVTRFIHSFLLCQDAAGLLDGCKGEQRTVDWSLHGNGYQAPLRVLLLVLLTPPH